MVISKYAELVIYCVSSDESDRYRTVLGPWGSWGGEALFDD